MERKMFCFQCEQTAGCRGCMGNMGVCGKPADTAELQDGLTGELISFACAAGGRAPECGARLMLEGLFTTVTNVNFNSATVAELAARVREARKKLGDDAPAYDVRKIWEADEDIRSLKSLILFGLRGMAAYAYHAAVLGYRDAEVDGFFFEALAALAKFDTMDELLPLVLKTGEVNLRCMELLDRANTESFGTPQPTRVSFTVEPGPFIVVTGHDLRDLKLLLEQTADRGVNVYTHGEMLPAHAYPELKKYPHLKGNFGTAWQNQQKEFDGIPAPILFTTNCLMPPKPSYADRVFTTEVVSFPGAAHIGEGKDFTPVIEKALELGGWPERRRFTGINGGMAATTGFGHGAVLAEAGRIVEAVKSGAIRHFFLVGGCDGAKTGRNYYTDFVKLTPADTIVLTLACGKYRFNDIDRCPESLLLWFHHVPWTHVMASQRTLWDELCLTYQRGVDSARELAGIWQSVASYIDTERFAHVEARLRVQLHDAVWWKDACLLYFQTFSRLPFPAGVEPPVYTLDELKQIKLDMKHHN